MKISDERRQYIADLANDEWVDRLPEFIPEEEFDALSNKMEEETNVFLRTVDNPEELHLFAELWNWDGGVERMMQVIEHPSCDAGTALMIYWLARPEYYLDFDLDDNAFKYEEGLVMLITTIETRYLNNEYKTRSISFNPRKEGMVGIYSHPSKWKRTLPEMMYEPILSENDL